MASENMATIWDDLQFLSLDGDELDDVFEPPSPTSLKMKSQECRMSDATSNYMHGCMTGSPTNSVSHIGTVCPEMVTLHSLSSGQDSGYAPSPSSFHSFTSSSDEDESTDLPGRSCPGITPPIAIPPCFRSSQRHKISRHSRQETFHKAAQNPASIRRDRSKSCPATSRASVLQRLPVSLRRTFTPVPTHGSSCFIPTGDTNRQCLLMSSHRTESTIIQDPKDLSKEGGTFGHQCRVLVLALPDLVVESGKESPDSNIQLSPTPACSSRSRAFSCEVTLAEEVGRKLRWIADSFSAKKTQSSPVHLQ
ncbi:uncharacterized protein LOC135099894 isoform X4 [Scylla paramamosain]|uniref:uncharacterized protein LOC135099894 isoform X4 n=1 Tax=Scylla paramamosain TaxID=85552 RepID=UPI003083B737